MLVGGGLFVIVERNGSAEGTVYQQVRGGGISLIIKFFFCKRIRIAGEGYNLLYILTGRAIHALLKGIAETLTPYSARVCIRHLDCLGSQLGRLPTCLPL